MPRPEGIVEATGMSLLPEGQPLRGVLPDLDDLLADPHAYLSEAPPAKLRRHGLVQASGLEVSGPQWRFTGLGEVCLPARYEIAAGDLGELLAWLGGRLGRDLPAGAAAPDEQAARVVAADVDPAG